MNNRREHRFVDAAGDPSTTLRMTEVRLGSDSVHRRRSFRRDGKINVKGNGQECPFHMNEKARLVAQRAREKWGTRRITALFHKQYRNHAYHPPELSSRTHHLL